MNTSKKTQTAVSAAITGTVLTFTFGNGDGLTIDAAQLSEQIRTDAMMHGLKQKLGDGAAIPRNTETGRAATIEEKAAAIKAIAARIMAGEWNAVARGTGEGSGGLLFRALMRMYPEKGEVRVRAWLDGKTDAQKTAMRNDPKVATVIAAIRAESGKAANIDTASLLGELGD